MYSIFEASLFKILFLSSRIDQIEANHTIHPTTQPHKIYKVYTIIQSNSDCSKKLEEYLHRDN